MGVAVLLDLELFGSGAAPKLVTYSMMASIAVVNRRIQSPRISEAQPPYHGIPECYGVVPGLSNSLWYPVVRDQAGVDRLPAET